MSKFIQNGNTIDYTNSGASKISYGDIVTLGVRVGVAAEDIAVGATGGVNLVGVYEVPAITTEAFVVGDVLYLDATGKATKTKGSLTVTIGMAVEAKVTAGAVALVRIN